MVMKKRTLLSIIPFLALVGCTSQPLPEISEYLISYENGLPVVTRDGSEHITYLMMSPFGYLDLPGAQVKGEVSDLFYENTIVWKEAAGGELPDASIVKSTVSGATFRGWAYYNEDNENVWPDYYTTVPSTSGLALKAIFDGTNAGGNQGGGGGQGGGGSQSQTGFGIIKGDGTYKIGESKGKNMDGYDEYLVTNMSFTAGETFSLFDPSTLGKWAVDINPYSFSPVIPAETPDPARVAEYVTKNSTDYTVNKDFVGDFYIQILYQQDRLYIELVQNA